MRIEAGDFPQKTDLTFFTFEGKLSAALWVPTGGLFDPHDYIHLTRDIVASLQLVSDEVVKDQAGATGGAIMGGLLLGPVGAVGGALMGGNTREVTFALELKDGRRMLAVITPEQWTKLRNIMF